MRCHAKAENEFLQRGLPNRNDSRRNVDEIIDEGVNKLGRGRALKIEDENMRRWTRSGVVVHIQMGREVEDVDEFQ